MAFLLKIVRKNQEFLLLKTEADALGRLNPLRTAKGLILPDRTGL
jgi:hypothetical protein